MACSSMLLLFGFCAVLLDLLCFLWGFFVYVTLALESIVTLQYIVFMLQKALAHDVLWELEQHELECRYVIEPLSAHALLLSNSRLIAILYTSKGVMIGHFLCLGVFN